jgi:hypothetical protein
VPKQIYIDESVRKTYVIPLVIVETEKINKIRKSLSHFVKSNHKNIHMFKANKAFKNRILKEVMSYDLQIVIIEDLNFRYRKYLSRQICLRSAFEFAAEMDVDRIVLDRSSSQEKDLTTYQKSSRKFPTLPENLHHIASRQEPLLWLPDIFAWSYGAGGIWRQSIDEKISFIKRV